MVHLYSPCKSIPIIFQKEILSNQFANLLFKLLLRRIFLTLFFYYPVSISLLKATFLYKLLYF